MIKSTQRNDFLNILFLSDQNHEYLKKFSEV